MSAVDCRSGKCSCAAKSEKLGEAERTVTQIVQYGWLNEDGSYDWLGNQPLHRSVTPVWALHVKSRITAIAGADGWLLERYNPEVPEAIVRIRWEPAEAVNRG